MTSHSFKAPTWWHLVFAAVMLVLTALGSARPAGAQGTSTLIPAPHRVDMVHDLTRNILYITSGGEVLRYHLGAQQFLPSFQLGGNLKGIDLSPDGNTLAVADDSYTSDQCWIYLVNLVSGASQKIAFARGQYDGGTWSVAYGKDGTILITGRFLGSGRVPLRKYNPASGPTTTLWTFDQDTMLSSSADGSVIGFAESNDSLGPWGRYRVSDGDIVERFPSGGTGWDNYEIGTNRNGTQFALPTYGGTFVYDESSTKIATLGQYAAPQPIGVVYGPVKDIVYFAWAETEEVRAFDTNSFAQVASYNYAYTFPHPLNNSAYIAGRLKVSRDGSTLFATVDGGIRYVRVLADTTPPTIVAAVGPPPKPNANGWNNTDVTVSWTVNDPESGIASATGCAAQTLTNDTPGTTLTCSAANGAGLSASQSVTVKIDKTPPTVTCTPKTSPNANGWYSSNVEVVTTATDASSGTPGVFPIAVLPGDGAAQSVTCTATDNAGNSASATASNINIDKSPPVLSLVLTAPNQEGWNNTDVSVTFECTDSVSGVASSSGSTTLTAEGAGQSVTGTCTDKAGNTVTQVVNNINIDKTPPTVTCAPKSQPNANGWYNADVLIIPATYSDAMSGVEALEAAHLTNDGAGQSATCAVGDRAGNQATGTASNINIDKTPPSMTVTRTPPNQNGWNNTGVSVTFGCTDSLSGVASSSGPSTLTTEGANQSVTGTCTDKADNTATQVVNNINIDKTPPTITGAPTTSPNANGWYNSNVVVHFTAADTLSGIDTVTPDQTLSADGVGQSAKGTATDKAGNTAATSVNSIKIDKTKPSVTITSPKAKDYLHTTTFKATWTTSDALSGVATASGKIEGSAVTKGQSVDLFYLSLGSHTFTVDASDKAGNAASASVAFTVVADINSLIAARERTCSLGWIKDKSVCANLDAKLMGAKEALEHHKPQTAKQLLNDFIKELDQQMGKAVNQQAYDLLKADALYVVGRIH